MKDQLEPNKWYILHGYIAQEASQPTHLNEADSKVVDGPFDSEEKASSKLEELNNPIYMIWHNK